MWVFTYDLNSRPYIFGRGKDPLVWGKNLLQSTVTVPLSQVRDHNILLQLIMLIVGLGHRRDPWVGRWALAVLLDGAQSRLLVTDEESRFRTFVMHCKNH